MNAADSQIAAMKAQLHVVTDSGLALALRMDKANLVKWRRQGRVSGSALRRSAMIARYGQRPAADSIETIAAETAVLADRLGGGNLSAGRVADMLEDLARRARAIKENA